MQVTRILSIACLLFASQAHAQVATQGVLLLVPANGFVTHVNDEASLSFTAQETGRDKAAAASLVNRKMKQGAAIVSAQDATAKLMTLNYTTSPVYKKGKGTVSKSDDNDSREIVGWRVTQSLIVTTRNLAGLPKMVAAAQSVLGLDSIEFGLSDALTRTLDEQRIVATYQDLNQRIASLAKAMGRKFSDATLETVDLAGEVGAFPRQGGFLAESLQRITGVSMKVAEPSFEPGETTLQMRLVGKVKFK